MTGSPHGCPDFLGRQRHLWPQVGIQESYAWLSEGRVRGQCWPVGQMDISTDYPWVKRVWDVAGAIICSAMPVNPIMVKSRWIPTNLISYRF